MITLKPVFLLLFVPTSIYVTLHLINNTSIASQPKPAQKLVHKIRWQQPALKGSENLGFTVALKHPIIADVHFERIHVLGLGTFALNSLPGSIECCATTAVSRACCWLLLECLPVCMAA